MKCVFYFTVKLYIKTRRSGVIGRNAWFRLLISLDKADGLRGRNVRGAVPSVMVLGSRSRLPAMPRLQASATPYSLGLILSTITDDDDCFLEA